jgi:hypothetical protein
MSCDVVVGMFSFVLFLLMLFFCFVFFFFLFYLKERKSWVTHLRAMGYGIEHGFGGWEWVWALA